MENHYSKPPCTASQTSSELQLAMSRKAARLAESSHWFSEAELSEISTEGIVTNRYSVGHADLEDSESQSLVQLHRRSQRWCRVPAGSRMHECARRGGAHIFMFITTPRIRRAASAQVCRSDSALIERAGVPCHPSCPSQSSHEPPKPPVPGEPRHSYC